MPGYKGFSVQPLQPGAMDEIRLKGQKCCEGLSSGGAYFKKNYVLRDSFF